MKNDQTPQQQITQSRQRGAQTTSAHLTGAGPIYLNHGQPMSLAKAITRNEVTFSPFLRAISSDVNVILTRQTYGQRLSMSTGSKRRALENHLYQRICHMIPILRYKRDSDLCLCTFWVLSKRPSLRNARFRFFCRAKNVFFGSRHCAAVLFSPVLKNCTDLDLSLLYTLILETYGRFDRTNNFLALGACFPQPCSSAGRRFAASGSRLHYYRRIASFPQRRLG